MSFQRTRYDPCEAKQYVTDSASAAAYPLNTPVLCGNCFPSDPRVIAQKTGVSMNTGVGQRFYSGPVDVESDLLGVNRNLSGCAANKFQATCMNGDQSGYLAGSTGSAPAAAFRKLGQRCDDNNLMDFPSCFFGVEDTRLTNPPSNIRGMTPNRFIPLLLPAQENVIFPGEAGIPSRIVFKDNHRACIPSLDVISAEPLPPAQPLPCPLSNPSCAAFNGPMYQYDVCG